MKELFEAQILKKLKNIGLHKFHRFLQKMHYNNLWHAGSNVFSWKDMFGLPNANEVSASTCPLKGMESITETESCITNRLYTNSDYFLEKKEDCSTLKQRLEDERFVAWLNQ